MTRFSSVKARHACLKAATGQERNLPVAMQFKMRHDVAMHRIFSASASLAIKLSVVLCPLIACGASGELRFYDVSRCEIFRISNEQSPDRAYQNMLAEAKDWDVYMFSGPSGGGRGLCKWAGSSYKHRFAAKFICNQTSRSYFPLAGATYSVIPDRGDIPSYRCATGCRKNTPRVLHYVGEEELDSQVNIEHSKTLEKFESKCGSDSDR